MKHSLTEHFTRSLSKSNINTKVWFLFDNMQVEASRYQILQSTPTEHCIIVLFISSSTFIQQWVSEGVAHSLLQSFLATCTTLKAMPRQGTFIALTLCIPALRFKKLTSLKQIISSINWLFNVFLQLHPALHQSCANYAIKISQCLQSTWA